MPESYPFHLEKHPKPKGPCPECGYANKFRFYEDLNGNRLDDFGKCERVNTCGYHIWPTGKAVPKAEGDYTPPPLPVQIYPASTVLNRLNNCLNAQNSPFHTYCTSIGLSFSHLASWRVGSEQIFDTPFTVFVHCEGEGRIVNAKWFRYGPDGKRIKARSEDELDSFSLKQPPADDLKRYGLCLYGEHLLDPAKQRPVMLVESEKSAVIASWFYKDYDWLATGSANGLTDAKIAALYGRRIYWLADADGNVLITDKKTGKPKLSEGGRSNSSIRKLLAYQQNAAVIDLFPDRTDGYDIADALMNGQTPDLETMRLLADVPPESPDLTTITTVIGKATAPKEKTKAPKSANSLPEAMLDEGPDEEEITFNDVSVWYHAKSHSILVKGQRGWNMVAEGFFLHIRYKTQDENENHMWVLELMPKGADKPVYVEISNDDFSSAARLSKRLLQDEFVLQATDTELKKIQQHLVHLHDYKSAIKIVRFGFHPPSGVFFFSNAAILNGERLSPDQFNIVQAGQYCLCMPTLSEKSKTAHPFTLTDNSVSFNDWFALFARTHLYENAVIPVCFYLMALFRDIAIDQKNFSPILYFKGGYGTGKSTFIRNLTCLYGYKAKDINLKSKNTAAALVKLMSQTSNTMVWMDEFYNGFEHEGLLQAAYDNAGYHLSAGVGNAETTEIDIKSALTLSSNFIPANDIFFSRCIYVPMNVKTKTDEQIASLNTLRKWESAGLACVTVELLKHREYLQANYKTGFANIYDGLSQTLPPDTDERLKSNMAQDLTIGYLLNIDGRISMCEYTEPDMILEEFVRIGRVSILRQQNLQRLETPLAKFFQILQNLYDEKRIVEGVHFKFEGPLISLRFSQLYTTFKQRYWQVNREEPPDKESVLSELELLMGLPGGELELKNIRFRPDEHEKQERKTTPVYGSCSVDYRKLVDRFDIDFTL